MPIYGHLGTLYDIDWDYTPDLRRRQWLKFIFVQIND